MFGAAHRVRRPVLLILVYGAFLVLVGITASAQAVMISTHFSAATLNDVGSSDSATVRAFVNAYVQPRYLQPGGASPEELAGLEEQLATLVRPREILRVELRLPDGTILASNDGALRGTRMPVTGDLALAVAGSPQAAIIPAEAADAGPGLLGSPTVLREFLPLLAEGKVQVVAAIWRDAVPILDRLAGVRRDVVVVTLSASLVAAAVLFLIFRSAQGRLTLQTRQLVESTRRDPLTGTLNHGALVGLLAERIEQARAGGAPIAIALIDIDNFRLLNENHGHGAGDEALLAVASLLSHLPSGTIAGRYGPDEFLIVTQGMGSQELEPEIERLRTALSGMSLKFETTDRLPVTISAGICEFPDDGASVTALLSTAALVLERARASGGDAIRVARADGEEHLATSTFDVLQGLVIAVDTKDRYTKRHSEDVARYAVFLAERLGLDADLIRAIRVAGLLHDVGKIGIPDSILRKPGKLDAAEYEVVKQHVALGDMIVRDLPDIELVRAGIRHHHERWDGEGYLDRLQAEEIPLVGRLLAVADAFSAMTTSRPYRRALDVDEALRRLGDAAGSQLEERLVSAFIEGIETALDPPLPGNGVLLPALWTPEAQVA